MYPHHPIARRARELADRLPAPGRRSRLGTMRVTGWVEIPAEEARLVSALSPDAELLALLDEADRDVEEAGR